MRYSRRDRTEAAISRIEAAGSLDGPGYAIGNALARPAQIIGQPTKPLRDALHGTRYGHPMHPMLVTIPIGTWTLALGLDILATLGVVRRRGAAHATDVALKAGAVGAVAAATAGLADWQYTDGRDRRLGLVHGLVNSTALALNLVSISLRRRGRRAEGRLASTAGWGCMFVGGYLGGHLVYRRRIGVDHADRSPEPRDFQPVLALAELQEDRPRRVEVRDEIARQDIGVVLVRHRGQIHAMGARCSHAGGPLDGGWVLGGTLVCPWHGSRYDLETGQPTDGPSTCPQPRYLVRVRDGVIEIRRDQEPGDEIVTAEPVERTTHMRAAADTRVTTGEKADEVLFEHHQFLRRLFERIETTPRGDPERRDLMRTLASELEIHEHVEDKIFYPAVQPVSEDIPVAHAEHRQLADLLAMTLKLSTASPAFEEHLKALHAALDHHAGSEEGSLFPQAQRLGEERLRALGHILETTLEDQRTSRFRRAFRDLKISLLEGL
ncbi:MAG: Rieske 2Fe-2S domain-containing protein [Pseudomonadota bacterium]|nr:Rieske 2Fe-2S domain-containing protein [Pseudomonadota bacterium]